MVKIRAGLHMSNLLLELIKISHHGKSQFPPQ